MISKMKKLISVCLAAFVVVALASCGGARTGANGIKSDIDINDIEWSVDQLMENGKRYVQFSYTNNTDCIITKIDYKFAERADLTEEEKAAYYADIQKVYDFSDEDVVEFMETPIEMTAYTERLAKPGDTISNAKLHYYTGYYHMQTLDQFEIVELDRAEIDYVKDGEIYTVSYDFKTDTYSVAETTETAMYWTESELGKLIPKPEVEVIREGFNDDEESFDCYAYGVTPEMFEEYVKQCKDMGFTKDIYEIEIAFDAYNESDNCVSLRYNPDDYILNIEIEK